MRLRPCRPPRTTRPVALTSQSLKALNVEDVLDLPALVPGLIAQPSGGSNLFLRGVKSASTGFNEAQTAVFIDGLYLANPAASITSFNNVERIEALNRLANTSRFSFNLNATYTLETEVGAFALSANDS